jgi:hypothetical protein
LSNICWYSFVTSDTFVVLFSSHPFPWLTVVPAVAIATAKPQA